MTAPPLADILAALGVLALEYDGAALRVAGTPPAWVARLAGPAAAGDVFDAAAAFPFLASLLSDPDPLWRQLGPDRVRVGEWAESDAAGNEFQLEAATLWVGRRRFLLITPADPAAVAARRELRDLKLAADERARGKG